MQDQTQVLDWIPGVKNQQWLYMCLSRMLTRMSEYMMAYTILVAPVIKFFEASSSDPWTWKIDEHNEALHLRAGQLELTDKKAR